MSNSFKKVGRIAVHVVMCGAVVFFFGRNTVLRIPAWGAIYKEYLTGFLVLGLFYGNMFVLFPQLFLKERLSFYLGAIALCLFGAVGAEIALVYPQIAPFLESTFGSEAKHVLFSYWVLILLRDLGFFLSSFAICYIRHQTQLKERYESRLKEIAHEVDVQSSATTAEYANINDILYCQQGKNVTWVFMLGGAFLTCYNSLKKMKKLIGEELVIDVSKGLFVMRDKIHHYDIQSITIEDTVLAQFHTFEWGQDYYECACRILHANVSKENTSAVEGNVSGEVKNSPNSSADRQYLATLFRKYPNLRPVYSYIQRHPVCKANDISSKLSIPIGTLTRILKQLKDEGLIEYIGSKKTGGYQVMGN